MMNSILRDFDKKNEFPKVKMPEFAIGGICNDVIYPRIDAFSQIDEIVKDIRDRQDNAIAMEFTKCIGELLKNNGVTPRITEYTNQVSKENSIETRYGVSIDKLDFSEHDKAFDSKIAKLEKENKALNSYLVQREKDATDIIMGLRQEISEKNEKIAELACENKETKADLDKPSAEWYENRHQQDCIEMNRLNTTIDVLIHKIEYLRQFAGLE